jgi:dihydrofolate reductase
MARVRVAGFTISLDGYGAGSNQDINNPLGESGMDVRIGGGAATIRQYLREGLVGELHVAMAPVLPSRGEPLFEGIDLRVPGHECVESAATEKAAHVVPRRRVYSDT